MTKLLTSFECGVYRQLPLFRPRKGNNSGDRHYINLSKAVLQHLRNLFIIRATTLTSGCYINELYLLHYKFVYKSLETVDGD
uniref:Uncharacterized protein n=1 Tax=Heterorhabditis bacteriophora TaxID=37862 RepID=A0A1I7XPA2_HETBA